MSRFAAFVAGIKPWISMARACAPTCPVSLQTHLRVGCHSFYSQRYGCHQTEDSILTIHTNRARSRPHHNYGNRCFALVCDECSPNMHIGYHFWGRYHDIALKNGIRYAYSGNIHHKPTQSTYCHNCGEAVIGRDWYELSEWNLQFGGNHISDCKSCGTQLAGVFEEKPGTWGRRRAPLKFKA